MLTSIFENTYSSVTELGEEGRGKEKKERMDKKYEQGLKMRAMCECKCEQEEEALASWSLSDVNSGYSVYCIQYIWILPSICWTSLIRIWWKHASLPLQWLWHQMVQLLLEICWSATFFFSTLVSSQTIVYGPGPRLHFTFKLLPLNVLVTLCSLLLFLPIAHFLNLKWILTG